MNQKSPPLRRGFFTYYQNVKKSQTLSHQLFSTSTVVPSAVVVVVVCFLMCLVVCLDVTLKVNLAVGLERRCPQLSKTRLEVIVCFSVLGTSIMTAAGVVFALAEIDAVGIAKLVAIVITAIAAAILFVFFIIITSFNFFLCLSAFVFAYTHIFVSAYQKGT